MQRFKACSILFLVTISACTQQQANSQNALRPPIAIKDVSIIDVPGRPNFVFILVDDLDLLLGTVNYMPNLQEEIIESGLTIENFFITTPVCCPARVSFLKGQYAHNHEVYVVKQNGTRRVDNQWRLSNLS
ncbi:MAG: hypothetical protein DWG76_06580 [Chloroflexi bacterium]|nr:hypothetical protein [Chloroflexota bacterium]